MNQETIKNALPQRLKNDECLIKAVEQIVSLAQPDQVILFGSFARGEGSDTSDLDFLVIKSGVHRRRMTQEIYRHLQGVDRAVDVIVAHPKDLEQQDGSQSMIYAPALREGITVYAA